MISINITRDGTSWVSRSTDERFQFTDDSICELVRRILMAANYQWSSIKIVSSRENGSTLLALLIANRELIEQGDSHISFLVR